METQPARAGSSTQAEYVPGFLLDAYREHIAAFPRFADVVLPSISDVADLPAALRGGNEFDTDVSGRGDTYRLSQRDPLVRVTGINALLAKAVGRLGTPVPEDLRLLDVLGGDGTVARAVAGQGGRADWILTGDVSRHMVAEALRYGLPAVCQPAQEMLVRDESFDAVLLAYGTHHIPPTDRKAVYAEAWRVLKPGGRLVVHDFEQKGPVATWFETVVHRYAPGGHAYSHFSADELRRDLGSVGFQRTEVGGVYDPFTVTAASAGQAVRGLVTYVHSMYGLFGFARGDDGRRRLWHLMRTHMRYPAGSWPVTETGVRERADGCGFVATMPRVALVAVGTKPA